MSKKKLTTAEILAMARRQATGSDAESPAANQAAEPAPSAAAPAEVEASASSPAEAAKPAGTPKSTKDILAAARAQKASGAAAEQPASTAAAPAAAKPAAPAGGRPKSTADILAAARGQAKAGAAKAPAATKSKPAAAAAGKAAPAGERPSVEEMLKVARGEGAAKSGVAVPVKPKLPPHPTRPAAKQAVPVTRRSVLSAIVVTPFALAWVAFTASLTFAALGVARFMLPNMLVEPPSRFKIGPPDAYPMETVSTKWKSEFNIWITHVVYEGQPMIYALSTVCTHLGCTPNWLEGEQKFKCPCHGSGFYKNGFNFEGPAPRPLERYGIRLAPDGMLEVDKSVKFQEEMGQWADPASFYPTA